MAASSETYPPLIELPFNCSKKTKKFIVSESIQFVTQL